MNDLTIDLTNARIPEVKTSDPWREEIQKDVERIVRDGDGKAIEVYTSDVVTITLDQPLTTPRGAQRLSAAFGPGRNFATLEAVRAWVRKRIEWEELSEDARLDLFIEDEKQSEREGVTQYALMRSVCVNPGMNFRALAEHMRANGWSGKDEEIRAAATALQTDDYGDVQPLRIEKGTRNASIHHPGEGVTSDAWSEEERIASETGDTADDQEIEL